MPVGKKSLKINEWRKNYSDKTVWTDMSRGTIYKKDVFQFSNFLWPKLPIFSKKSHFLPLNGWNNCHKSGQSCPRWWRKLTNKKICCGIKIDNCGIKSVRQWIGLRRLYTSFTHFTEVIRRRNHQKSAKIKIPQKITSNVPQPTSMYHHYDS